ncbi:MAG: hypothetical protein ACRD5H_18860, partial [Nitrososphaerales archaeon]
MAPSPEFDIRTHTGRQGLAQHHPTTERQDALTSSEIVDGLASLVNYLGSQDWMIWRYGWFALPSGPNIQRGLSVPEAVKLGLSLRLVSHCHRFSKLLEGFNNPSQFDDTCFEAEMASWCVKLPTVENIRFAPHYQVAGKQKRPEFELVTPIGLVVCECKRLHLPSQKWAKRLDRVAEAFDAAMKSTVIPPETRLEVVITKPITTDLSTLAADICHQVMHIPEGKAFEHGPFSIRRCRV